MTAQVSSRARPELVTLGETLDSLFGRLEASFESQRRFVANASHELRTPLTAERTLLQVASLTQTQPFQRLGLAIVRAIASAHGATLAAKACPEGGLDIEVSFPDRRGDGAAAEPGNLGRTGRSDTPWPPRHVT